MGTDYQGTTIASGVQSQSSINAEWQAIELALGRMLNVYGDDTVGTNAMQVDIDMNSNTIINLAQPVNANDAARLADVSAVIAAGLPDQTGHANKLLTTDGSAASWTDTLTVADLSITTGDIHMNGGHAEIGDAGFEEAGIDINGVVYTPKLRVNDIGTANPAQMVLHRHSTTLQPLILGARTNDESTSHTAVTAGQGVFSMLGAGYTGSHYDIFGSIDIVVSSEGSISATSSPGKVVINTTPDGSNTPTAVLTVDQDRSTQLEGIVKLQEVAAAVADTAGYGQLWIKNSAPNELWFTDDDGSDFSVTMVRKATSAQLNDITDAVNTGPYKEVGVEVFNTDTVRSVWASGNADGSTWHSNTGAAVHTPA